MRSSRTEVLLSCFYQRLYIIQNVMSRLKPSHLNATVQQAGIWPELGLPRRPEMPMVGPCSYRLCMAAMPLASPLYEFQMQYGSIGWSVGATLGYAQAVPEKRVIACIGDGSFQACLA
ncbi:hypothetical protein KIW84_012353 [Lathyrus oleraceus]|uniref:pyruvate decarboxylase n=1 Tax=Pisum sativum TaxID=3888 RepID=A0A9D5BHB1_PEA|nr:hypothetical protein KIW84_012353 [Pisum sativum]